MSSRKFPRTTFQVQSFLDNPNAKFLDLSKCSNLSSLLLKNKEFQAKFLSSKFLLDLFKILEETDNYSVHTQLISVSTSLSPILATRFSDNIQITEAAFEVLKNRSNKSSYAFGTISVFLFYAIHKYPEKMQDIFDLSDKIYPIMIENVDKLCMFNFIRDLISDKFLKLDYFVWLCFLNLIGKNDGQHISPMPLCQSSRDIVGTYYIELSDSHRQHIIQLLALFFQKSEDVDVTFRDHVSRFLSSQKSFQLEMFELALSIPPTNEMAQIALDTVLKSIEISGLAIEYLTKCVAILSIDTIEFLLLYLLSNQQSSNLVLMQLPKIVKYAVEKGNESHCINILMYCWNQEGKNESLKKDMIIKYFLEIQDLLSNPLPQDFISTVIDPWKNEAGDVNFAYQFDSSLVDEDSIHFLNHLFEQQP